MHCKIEPISGMMRVWVEKRDDSVHNTGIPFLLSATIRWISPTKIEIMGLSPKEPQGDDDDSPMMTLPIWKAIGEECLRWGVEKIFFTRYKNGKRIEKWVSFRSRSKV